MYKYIVHTQSRAGLTQYFILIHIFLYLNSIIKAIIKYLRGIVMRSDGSKIWRNKEKNMRFYIVIMCRYYFVIRLMSSSIYQDISYYKGYMKIGKKSTQYTLLLSPDVVCLCIFKFFHQISWVDSLWKGRTISPYVVFSV